MNRTSSRKDLRNERLASSPYSRRERSVKKQESKSTLSSIFSYVSSSLRRTISRNDINNDDMSVSGSEDEWNGEPPAVMRGQDMFSLAAAGGRSGDDFEQRAQTWRQAKPLLASTSRNGLSSSKSAWELLDLSEEKKVRPSPSMPVMPNFQNTPAPQSSKGRPPQMFATPAGQSSKATEVASPSYNALRAYLDSNGHDLKIIESLTRELRTENTQPPQTGGWSAGLATPGRSSTPLKPTTVFPGMPGTPGTPGSTFSLGASPAASSSRKVTYLGPGMSPRRLPRSRIAARPLFADDTMTGKKRKANGWVDLDVEVLEEQPVASTSDRGSTLSGPIAAAESAAHEFNTRSRLSVSGHSQVRRPSPLGKSTSSPDKDDAMRAAKKRANNVLEDIYDEVVGPSEPPQRTIQVNPYEKIARPEKMGTEESFRRSNASLRKSLRSSMTASRGAAQKLEQLKGSGRKLTTLELVGGYKSNSATPSSSSAKIMEVDAGDEDDEDEDDFVDELINASPIKAAQPPTVQAPTPVRSFAPARIDEPEPFQPFKPSSLSQSTSRPAVSSPAPQPVQPEVSATFNSIKEASEKSKSATPAFSSPAPPAKKPESSATPLGLGAPPPTSSSSQTLASRPVSRRRDPSAIYLSAKDTALSVDRAALPFFTFTMPSNLVTPSNAVMEAVRNASASASASASSFSFSLQQPSLEGDYCSPPHTARAEPEKEVAAPAPAAPASGFSLPTPAAADGEWECDTCMLKNPPSAKEKCTICDAKKPGAAPAAPAAPPAASSSAPAFGFSIPVPASAAGEWECDTCMLKNPASATEKCTICDAKKPGAALAAPPAAPASAPAFGFSMPVAASTAGEWECDTCMLKNPATATDKCKICDAPKPGAAPSATRAAPAAAMPSAPSGGFTFGAPAAKSSSMPPAPSGGFSFGAPAASGGFKPSIAPPSGGFTIGVGAPSGGFSFVTQSSKPQPISKPTGGEGEWTCGLCMLKNPASATDKCTVCEAPKP